MWYVWGIQVKDATWENVRVDVRTDKIMLIDYVQWTLNPHPNNTLSEGKLCAFKFDIPNNNSTVKCPMVTVKYFPSHTWLNPWFLHKGLNEKRRETYKSPRQFINGTKTDIEQLQKLLEKFIPGHLPMLPPLFPFRPFFGVLGIWRVIKGFF